MNHDRLTKAASDVADWNARIWKLREDIGKAETALAESQHRRQEHVLEAALGDDDAKSRLADVLNADRDADRLHADLQLALPAAEAKLREAEAAHRIAEAEWRRAEVERTARCRVEAAAEIDRAFADFSAAWSKYESLGHELFDLASQEPNANALFLAETISGEVRLAASLPAKPFMAIRERFNFLPISTSKSLAAAEALYWRLPAAAVKAA
jgi:hypothetical protein